MRSLFVQLFFFEKGHAPIGRYLRYISVMARRHGKIAHLHCFADPALAAFLNIIPDAFLILSTPISVRSSLVDLVKRPRVIEAAVPNLIHHLVRMLLVLTPRSRSHTQRRSPPYALLQLLCDPPLPSCEELPSPPTLAAKRTRANLRTRRVPQVVHGVHLEAQVVVGVHHLVRQRVLHVSAVAHLVGADQDAVLGIEAAALSGVAFTADHARGVHGCAAVARAQQVDVVFEEAHDWRVVEEPFFVVVAALAVDFFVEVVFCAEVGFALPWAGAAG